MPNPTTQSKPRYTSDEQTLINEVISFLVAQGVDAWRQQNSGEFVMSWAKARLKPKLIALNKAGYANETQISAMLDDGLRAGWKKVEGSRLGVPDVIGVMANGRFIGVEIKIGADQLSEHQERFRDMLEQRGAEFYVARDYREFVTQYNRRQNLKFKDTLQKMINICTKDKAMFYALCSALQQE
jgi:VRR-NUC domain